MRVRIRLIMASALATCLTTGSILAQIPALPAFGDWFGELSVGQMGFPPDFYGEYTMISAHWMQMRLNRPGVELVGSVFPWGIASKGPFSSSIRLGMTWPAKITEKVALTPTGGVRLLFGNPSYENARNFSLGVQGGLSLIAGDVGPVRLRFGVTREQFLWTDGAFWILEVGAIRRKPMHRGLRVEGQS